MKPALSLALCALTFGVAMAAQAQTTSQAPTPGPSDPSFSAYTLAQQCAAKSDNAAQGQCVGAVRGIVRGYQYGVLFLSQRASLPVSETQRVSLCLTDTQVSSIVDDFIADAKQVSEADLRRTPAEVAVLGSVHAHHACT
ncbi:hypothetical protein CR51_06610 [Caballeronia megalochromosomata]|jgi:hypothetical protein|nr:hypothetical protein CR51_06610 [Caballeronia megalochromosomata]